MTGFCPLCSHPELRKSWLSTDYIKFFEYYQCLNCRSLVCTPMPDEEILLQMYSGDYFEDGSSNKFERVLEYLKTLQTGVFLDFGCGSGRFLESVYQAGWEAVGVEFSPETVKKLQSAYPFEIVQVGTEPSKKADVLHLADVLEHLTDLENQMPQILSLAKPGAVVIAHGPLEANPNLFQKVIEYSRRLRGGAAHMPPYHVTLATTEGQRALFHRFGLKEIEFKVQQIYFPARESFRESHGLRMKLLYLLRRVSQLISPETKGNHYYFIGKIMP